MEDRKNNIHHFYIGRDRGIVKGIEFSSKEIEGRAEAIWSAQGTTLEKAMFLIPRVYDVVVTLVGNNLFESGQTFYVNPTMGTTLHGGKDGLNIIKNTGLGGYYYVSKVETILKEGQYETKLHGTKIYLDASSQRTSFNAASDMPGGTTIINNVRAPGGGNSSVVTEGIGNALDVLDIGDAGASAIGSVVDAVTGVFD